MHKSLFICIISKNKSIQTGLKSKNLALNTQSEFRAMMTRQSRVR